MNFRVVSFYTLLYILVGYRFKILFCDAASNYNFEDINILDSGAEENEYHLVELDISNKRSTDKFNYKSESSTACLFTAKPNYRINKISSSGNVIWTPTKNEFPNRVYFEERTNDKPLLKLIYSDEEYQSPVQQLSHAQVKKTAKGQAYTEITLPPSGDDASVRSRVRSASGSGYLQVPLPSSGKEDDVKTKVPRPMQATQAKFPSRRVEPVASHPHLDASDRFAEYSIPATDSDDNEQTFKTYAEYKLPASDDDVSVRSRTSLRAKPKRYDPQQFSQVSEKGTNYVQMAIPATESEDDVLLKKSPSTMPTAFPGASYVQMPLPASESEDDVASRRTSRSMPRDHSKVMDHPAAGPSYVQMPLPPSDNEGTIIQPTSAAAHVSAPMFKRGESYVQMALPATSGEEPDMTSHLPSKFVPKTTSQSFVQMQLPATDDENMMPAQRRPAPFRSGVDDGQNFLEFTIPRTDDEGAAQQHKKDYLEIKLASSSAEEPIPQQFLPKRKALTTPDYHEATIPATTEAESGDEYDAEILALTQKIEKLQEMIEQIRKKLAAIDEERSRRAHIPPHEARPRSYSLSEALSRFLKIYTLEDNTLYENDTTKYTVSQPTSNVVLYTIKPNVKCVKVEFKNKQWNFNPVDPSPDYATKIEYNHDENLIKILKQSSQYSVLTNVN